VEKGSTSIMFVLALSLRLQTKAAACVRSRRLAIGADDLDARGRSPCASKDPAIVRRRSRGSLPRLHLSHAFAIVLAAALPFVF
jgi:hypothetical protein